MAEHTVQVGETTLAVDTDGAWVTKLSDARGDILFPRQSLRTPDGETKLRGGCHVCVPQFGPARAELDLPQHGFGRDSLWTLQKQTDATLVFHLAPEHEDYIDLQIILRYALRENSLLAELSLYNDGGHDVRVAPGFHPYFATGDAVTIGIDCEAIDVEAYAEMKPATGPQKQIEVQGRIVTVASDELNSWALWSDRLGDYFCVEPTLGGYRFLENEANEDKVLAPGGHATYMMTISW